MFQIFYKILVRQTNLYNFSMYSKRTYDLFSNF